MLESSCMIFINLQRIEKINELKSGYQPCPVEFDATKHLEKINQNDLTAYYSCGPQTVHSTTAAKNYAPAMGIQRCTTAMSYTQAMGYKRYATIKQLYTSEGPEMVHCSKELHTS